MLKHPAPAPRPCHALAQARSLSVTTHSAVCLEATAGYAWRMPSIGTIIPRPAAALARPTAATPPDACWTNDCDHSSSRACIAAARRQARVEAWHRACALADAPRPRDGYALHYPLRARP